MKQGIPGDCGRIVQLTPDGATQNMRHFLRKLNRKLYGNAAWRFGKSVRIFPVLERSHGDRLHYHAVIDRPEHLEAAEFAELVMETWRTTDWGHNQVDIQDDADEGWLKYILKGRTKAEFDDAIDV